MSEAREKAQNEQGMAVYHFVHGIPGFEQVQSFVFEEVEGVIPMRLMKSPQEEYVSLLVTSPFFFYPDYEWELSEASKQELGIASDTKLEVWSVITVPDNPMDSTINLLAPIILNLDNKTGKQMILHDYKYSSRAPLASVQS